MSEVTKTEKKDSADVPVLDSVPAEQVALVPAALVQAILQYLSGKPYIEVAGLVQRLLSCERQ